MYLFPSKSSLCVGKVCFKGRCWHKKNWGLLHSPYKFPLLVRSLVLGFVLGQKLSKCNLRFTCAHASLDFFLKIANVLALHNSKQQHRLSFHSAIAKVLQISQDLLISLVFLHFTSRCCQSRFLHFQYIVIHIMYCGYKQSKMTRIHILCHVLLVLKF